MAFSDLEAFRKRFKRKPSDALALLAALVVVVAVGAFVTAYFSEKGKLAAEPAVDGGKPRPRAPLLAQTRSQAIAVEQIIVGTSVAQNRVDFALRNNSDNEVLINRIQLSAKEASEANVCIAHMADGIVTTSISDLVITEEIEGGRITGRFEEKSAPGFDYPVSGTATWPFCGSMQLTLETQHAVKLPQHSLSVWHVIIPRTVRLMHGGDGRQRLNRAMNLNLSAFHELAILAEESSGAVAEKRISPQSRNPTKEKPAALLR